MAAGDVVLNIKMKPWAVRILKPLWFIQVLRGCKIYLPGWAFTIEKPKLQPKQQEREE